MLLSVRFYLKFGTEVSGLKSIARFSDREYINACLILCINMSCVPNISTSLYLSFLCMCAPHWRGIFAEYCVLERKALSAVTGPRGQQQHYSGHSVEIRGNFRRKYIIILSLVIPQRPHQIYGQYF